ncbi:MAG: aldehyde dehydrogenase family protein, partial [Gemmatimonadetes bacterium]
MKTELLIGNEWRSAAKRYCLTNPATEEPLAEVAEAGEAEIDAAVTAARACLESKEWRDLPARRRGQLLYRVAELLEQRAGSIAEVETKNNGKPLFESKIDVAMAIETFRYYAGWADKLTGDTLPVSGPFFTYTLREPVGVAGAIVPWNFPLNLAT